MSIRSVGGGGEVQDTTHIQEASTIIIDLLEKEEEMAIEVKNLHRHQEVREIIIDIGLEYMTEEDIMKILKVEYLV